MNSNVKRYVEILGQEEPNIAEILSLLIDEIEMLQDEIHDLKRPKDDFLTKALNEGDGVYRP